MPFDSRGMLYTGVELKTCSKCRHHKSLSEFWKCAANKDGLQRWCKPCLNEDRRERNRRYIASGNRWRNQRSAHYERCFGITAEDVDRMAEEQGGVCKICNSLPGQKALHVDHDHRTGAVRGLLCFKCNVALGYFADNVDLLERAIEYLRSSAASE